MLVDDSAVVRERVAATLSALGGVEWLAAGEVLEGLQLIRETQPDLLILDIGLPGERHHSAGNSKEGTRAARHDADQSGSSQVAATLRELGADYYFHKPTEFEKMI